MKGKLHKWKIVKRPLLFASYLLMAQAVTANTSWVGEGIYNFNETRQTTKSNERIVTGTVVDKDGMPLAGVSIVGQVKGKEVVRGITDMEGRFKLSLPEGDVKLKFSFVGFCACTQTATPGKSMKIILDEDEQLLDEVVVTGYQVIDRRKSTSAVTSVNMEDILAPNMTSIDEALEGRIPDLLYLQNSGEAGATARLRVRGTSTLVGNREPLWVLDGFILQDPVDVSTEQLNDPDYINYIGNAIAGINPQDIERVDVLKDAAATALYGTRASNGVIVVTTKKGRVGPPTIAYTNQTKLTVRPHYSDKNINLMNSQERMQFGKDLCELHYQFPESMPLVGYEGAYYRLMKGLITRDEFYNEVARNETVNTDWFDLLLQNALTQSHTLSLSGGTEGTRYYASLGYTSEEGNVKREFVERYTAAMNIMTNISENLKANIRINANVQKKNHFPNDVNVLNYAYETSRTIPAYNEDGSLYYYGRHAYSNSNISSKSNQNYKYNILNEMENTSSEYSGNTFIASADLTYSLKTIADFTVAASYTRSATSQATWFGEKTNYVAILKNGEVDDMPIEGDSGYCELPYGGVYNTNNTIAESFTARLQANLHWLFGSDNQHLLTSTLGYEVNMSRNNSTVENTRGFYRDRGMQYVSMDSETLENFPYYETWVSSAHPAISINKTNQLSGYLTLSYDYKSYFTIGLSGRFDASNKFGSRSNEKFLPVWSVSGRWNVKDTFLPEAKDLNDLTLRFSYGKTGNMIDGETPNLLIYQGTMNSYFGEYESKVSKLPNPNLRWEQTAQYNLGFDLNLFNRGLMLSGDLWYKYTTEAFSTVNVSPINGVTSYNMNNGDIKNKGFSITVSGYPMRLKDWSLYLSLSNSWAANTVQSNTNETYNINDYLNGTAIVPGKSIGTFYSYKFLGLNPKNGIPMFDDYDDRQHLLAGKPLDYIVPLVMAESGNRNPKFVGAFYSTLTWKQLSLNMGFGYSVGSKVRLFGLYGPIVSGISSDKNVRKEFVNRWQQPGDEKYTNIPVLISPSDALYAQYANHWTSGIGATLSNIPSFGNSVWNMYDLSDLRVASGDYFRLSNLSLSYTFKSEQLKYTFLKSLRLSATVTNAFTLASSKLDGQDPSQPGFTGINLSLLPSYTFGLNVSF